MLARTGHADLGPALVRLRYGLAGDGGKGRLNTLVGMITIYADEPKREDIGNMH
jgi:hypothetical protein